MRPCHSEEKSNVLSLPSKEYDDVKCFDLQIFGSPSDVLGVLLFGTEKNHEIKDFDHLSLLLPLNNPEGKYITMIEDKVANLKDLENDVGALGGQGCKVAIHEALWQCQSLFNGIKGNVGMKKVLLFTTNDDPHANEPVLRKQALKKAIDLSETDIVLEIIPLGQAFEWSKFYGEMISCSEEMDGDAQSFGTERSEQKLQDLMRIVRKRVHKKRSTGRCHLDMGNGVKLAISTYNFVQRAYKPSKIRLTRDTNEEVRTLRQFLDPNTGAPLLTCDISKFMEYGKKKIKLSQDEVRATQKSILDGTFGLKLLAFKPISELKWCDFVRSSNFIYPDEKSIKGSKNLFAALLIKCLERQVMPICTYKARETSSPSFVALFPQEELIDHEEGGAQKSPPGFLLVYLPFVDDFRELPPNSQPLLESSEEQKASAKRVIKKLKMKRYDPEAFENPSLQNHYRLVEALALQRSDVEDDGNPIDNTMPPFEIMRRRLGNLSNEFLAATEPDASVIQMVNAAKRPAAPSYHPRNTYGRYQTESMMPKVENLAMGDLVRDKKVDKLTVDKLKTFLKSVGIAVSNKKKTELVQAIYDHFSK